MIVRASVIDMFWLFIKQIFFLLFIYIKGMCESVIFIAHRYKSGYHRNHYQSSECTSI